MSQAAAAAERVVGHDTNATTQQDVSNPNREASFADSSGEKMKALAWMGKNKVEIGASVTPGSVEHTRDYSLPKQPMHALDWPAD